jgi:hypothetical protein
MRPFVEYLPAVALLVAGMLALVLNPVTPGSSCSCSGTGPCHCPALYPASTNPLVTMLGLFLISASGIYALVVFLIRRAGRSEIRADLESSAP